jgi:uncharacterized protein (TIGR00297 family)
MLRRAVIGVGVAGAVAWTGFRRQALTPSGAWAGWFSGAAVTAGGWNQAIVLLAFFLSSSALSRLPMRRQTAVLEFWEKGSRRDAVQVAANGGIATLAGLAQAWRPGTLAAAAGFGSLAAASADTWATEIGARYGGGPRRITDGKRLAPGASGGVTVIGLLGSVAGALFIAMVAVALPDGGRRGRREQLLLLACAGITGSLVDSALGATMQATRLCPVCLSPTERRVHRCGAATTMQHGVAWVDNDVVNCCAAAAGAAIVLTWEALRAGLSYRPGSRRLSRQDGNA